MATDSSILVWQILRTEEPGGLQSMGLKRVTQLSNQTTQHSNSNNHHTHQPLFDVSLCISFKSFLIFQASIQEQRSDLPTQHLRLASTEQIQKTRSEHPHTLDQHLKAKKKAAWFS